MDGVHRQKTRTLFPSIEILNEMLRDSEKRVKATSHTVDLPSKNDIRRAVRIAKKNNVFLVKDSPSKYKFASAANPMSDPGLFESYFELRKFKGVNTVRVAKMIAAEGYVIAHLNGYRAENIKNIDGNDTFGILKEKQQDNNNKKRADYIAEIWFDNEPRGATPTKWVMEIFGVQNKEEMIKLRDRLQQKNKTQIEIQLSEEYREEAFISDIIIDAP